jgi:hypothetical protein
MGVKTGLLEGRSVVNGEPEPAEPGTAMKEEESVVVVSSSRIRRAPKFRRSARDSGELDRINNHADKLSQSGELGYETGSS